MAWVGRNRALAVAGVVAAVVAGIAVWYVNQNVSKSLPSYWLIDERTIGVQATDGRNATCWVMQPVETADVVRVDVQCHPGLLIGSSTAEGYPYRFAVLLDSSLGERRVVDGLGNESQLCAPECGLR